MKLAFDIGCNHGSYSKLLVQNGYDLVVAVDPNNDLFHSPSDKIIRINKACSSEIGTVDFYFANCDTISTASQAWVTDSRFANNYQWYKTTVETTTIDQLVEQYGIPHHIKVDVEGYEENVLIGMTKKYSEELCFEWAEEFGKEAINCVKYLSKLGYKLFGFDHSDNFLVKPKEFYSLDIFMQKFNYDINRKTDWGMIWCI